MPTTVKVGDRVYTFEPYRARAPGPAAAVRPVSLISGVGAWEFTPVTLHLMATAGAGIDGITPEAIVAGGNVLAPPSGAAIAGDVVVQVRGVLKTGGWYLRRFAIPLFRMVQIDISTWTDLWVDVLISKINGGDVVAVVSDKPTNSTIKEVFLYGEEYPNAGAFLVPPGADRLYPGTADAGFTWSTSTFGAAGVVQILEALAVGASLEPKGTHFTTTVAPSAHVWRVVL